MCGGVGGERFALHLIQPKVLFVIAAKLACPLVQLVVLEASVIAPAQTSSEPTCVRAIVACHHRRVRIGSERCAPRVRHKPIDLAECGGHRQGMKARIGLVVHERLQREIAQRQRMETLRCFGKGLADA